MWIEQKATSEVKKIKPPWTSRSADPLMAT